MIRRLLARFRRSPSLIVTPELERRIRQSFDDSASDEEHFPSTIDPRIFHVQLLLRYFGDLNHKRILDVGCGKGRFARVFATQWPAARISATDISTAMLAYVQPPLYPCAATMTALPFASATFDAVYATESLEHAIDIPKAVAEICRVTRSGGKIAIIDKNAEQWGRLETPEWERWFHRRELEQLLARHCRSVSSQFISYWEDVPPDGLFLAWLAEK